MDCVVDNQKKGDMITFDHKIDKNIIHKLIFGEMTLQKKHISHHSKKKSAKMQANIFHANRRIWCGNSWPLGKLLHHYKKVRIENGVVWIQYKRASFSILKVKFGKRLIEIKRGHS